MDYEKIFLNTLQLADKKGFLNNDALCIPWNHSKIVVASDAFVENVHFRAKWYYAGALKEMVQKAFFVNCSDLYACNALPKYAILSLGLSSHLKPTQVKELANSILSVCRECGVSLVGGDTFLDNKLSFSLTLLGVKQGRFLERKGIKKNDVIVALSDRKNPLGKVRKDLHYALRYDKIRTYSRFFVPKIHPKMLFAFNKVVHVGMDISDGIMLELERLSKLNKVGFKWLVNLKNPLIKQMLLSPEEYQMLYALNLRELRGMQRLAQKFRIKVIKIAVARRGVFKSHFKNWHST